MTKHVSQIILVMIVFLLPSIALAVSTTYELRQGNIYVSAYLEGDPSQTSIFLGASTVPVTLKEASVTFDGSAGAFGRLEDLSITADDFTLTLDTVNSDVSLETVNVFNGTVTSTAAADLYATQRFMIETEITADISGTLPGGVAYPNPGDPSQTVAVQSVGGTSQAQGVEANDSIQFLMFGVTLGTFDQLVDPNAPRVVVQANYAFFADRVTNPIPEPAAAVMFGAGLIVAGMSVRRRK